MEYFNQSKICREFLSQYSDEDYPQLLPKLMKVAIYSLHKMFHKWYFSMQELDEFINYFNYKNRNFELESKYNNCPNPPCEEYLRPKINGIKKLNMGFRPPEEENKTEVENGAVDCYGYGKYYPNDDVYINEKNNFYDENYYIPRNHSYRNIQLYHKRLANPKFITQEKRIYPHWWWNLKDDIEQDDYSDDDSEVDHVPSRKGRFPKNIEERLKKKAKRHLRNKSFSGIRPVQDRYYDEAKIFPNSNLITNDNSPFPKRDYSPSEDDSRRPFGGTGTGYDGFGRPFPNTDNNNYNPLPNNSGTDNNPDNNTLSTSPLYATSPNYYHPPQTGLPEGGGTPGQDTLNNRPGVLNTGFGPDNGLGFGDPKNPNFGSQSPYGPNGQGINPNNTLGSTGHGPGFGMSSSLYGTNPLKSQILNKRMIKQSTVLSYDKDFNVNGAFKKVKGQAKKGLKYSLSGNQLKEDIKGIRRRRK